MNDIIKTATIEEALKEANRIRKSNKNNWIFLEIHVGSSSPLLVKSYNTSIQIMRKDGINHPSTWDASVKDWTAAIADALAYDFKA